MSPYETLSNFILINELKLERWIRIGKSTSLVLCQKVSDFEVCTRCALPAYSIYDHRTVTVKDSPVRGKEIYLRIKKRRFFCKNCKKPFTEPVSGILPKRKTSQRFRRSVLWACENFSCMKQVQKEYRCSSGFLYKILYEQLSLQIHRHINYPWPKIIGIDEHFFSRKGHKRHFATVFTDIKNKRLREVVLGKDKLSLFESASHIPGREHVRLVALDLADSYKSFVKEFFPNAHMVADKFHVLRLLTPAINRRRKQIVGSKHDHPIRKLLLRSGFNLAYYERNALKSWLKNHPELMEIYHWKERLHSLYRIKGFRRAIRAYFHMLDEMKSSSLFEIQRLRRTLKRWSQEILNYFRFKITNARTEGFNRIASLVKNRAFGYRSFKNYRLRLLTACSLK